MDSEGNRIHRHENLRRADSQATASANEVDYGQEEEQSSHETDPLIASGRLRGSGRKGPPASRKERQSFACSSTDSEQHDPTTGKVKINVNLLDELRLYPHAVIWSMFFSLGIVMAAYDPQLLGNLYATPAFQRDFGYLYKGRYVIKAAWQTGLSMGSPIGQIVGAFIATYPMERYGRKVTFGACVVLTASFIFIQFFATSLWALLAGEILGGLVLGTYAVIAPAYASEVCPISLRGILTSYVNLCFVFGQLIANCVVAITSRFDSHWAYRLPFATQWIWPVIIVACLPWAPESPWWLVRQGRMNDARASLRKLTSPEVDIEMILDSITKTDQLEQSIEAGATHWDCFRSVNLRRTKIAIGVYTIQVVSGVYLVGYATYFFELAGLPPADAFSLGIIFLALGLIGTIFSWYLLTRFGRRPIYLLGLAVLALLLFIVGILDCVPTYLNNKTVIWAQSCLLMAWNFVYDLSIGPVCFVILCEVSATRLRSKTIAVATAFQALLAIGMTIAIPYMINPDQADLRGKIGFFFGGLATIGLVWAWFSVPETYGRSYEELDLMFSQDVFIFGIVLRVMGGRTFDAVTSSSTENNSCVRRILVLQSKDMCHAPCEAN